MYFLLLLFSPFLGMSRPFFLLNLYFPVTRLNWRATQGGLHNISLPCVLSEVAASGTL